VVVVVVVVVVVGLAVDDSGVDVVVGGDGDVNDLVSGLLWN
jgi:hypothetical protein